MEQIRIINGREYRVTVLPPVEADPARQMHYVGQHAASPGVVIGEGVTHAYLRAHGASLDEYRYVQRQGT